jgi:hypothetical protein
VRKLWRWLNTPIPKTPSFQRLVLLVEFAWLLWLIAGCNFHEFLWGI